MNDDEFFALENDASWNWRRVDDRQFTKNENLKEGFLNTQTELSSPQSSPARSNRSLEFLDIELPVEVSKNRISLQESDAAHFSFSEDDTIFNHSSNSDFIDLKYPAVIPSDHPVCRYSELLEYYVNQLEEISWEESTANVSVLYNDVISTLEEVKRSISQLPKEDLDVLEQQRLVEMELREIAELMRDYLQLKPFTIQF